MPNNISAQRSAQFFSVQHNNMDKRRPGDRKQYTYSYNQFDNYAETTVEMVFPKDVWKNDYL